MDYFDTKDIRADLKSKAIKSAGLTIFSQFAVFSIQMLSVIVLARILTPKDFGLVAMVTSISGFFIIFRRFGLTDATVQREHISHEEISNLFWINALFSLFLTIVFASISPFLVFFYDDSRLLMIAVVTSLGFVVGGLSTQHLALLKRNMQFLHFTVIEITAALVSVVAALTIAFFGGGYWALVCRPLVLVFATLVGAWTVCRWRPGLPSRNSDVRPMLKFGMYYLGSSTVNYFSQNIDKILIGWKYGPLSLGLYHRAYYLLLAPAQQLTYPLSSVANATLSRLVLQPTEYRKYFFRTIGIISCIAFLISAVLTISGKDVVLLLLGSQWEEAGPVFSVFSLGIGIQMLYPAHSWLHISLGRTDRLLRWGICNACFIILSFVIGLPFGIIGVTISYTIATYMLLIPALYYAGKPIDIGILDIIVHIWRYFLSGVLAGTICWYFISISETSAPLFNDLNVILRIIIATLSCSLLYVGCVILFYQSASPIIDFYRIGKEMFKRNK